MRRAFTSVELLAVVVGDFIFGYCRRRAWIVLLLVTGCAPQGKGLADQDAAFKIPAIKNAVEDHDPKATGAFIDGLDSDDPAVRLYAIEALRRMTGETFDYHYYDDAAARKPAIDRWKTWAREHHS